MSMRILVKRKNGAATRPHPTLATRCRKNGCGRAADARRARAADTIIGRDATDHPRNSRTGACFVSQRRGPRAAELPHLLRLWLAAAGNSLRGWCAEVREEPALLLRSPAARIAGWILLGVIFFLVVQALIAFITPAAPGRTAEKATPWATLYVACANPECRAAYATQTAMDFRAWPLKCERCGQMSVYRAARCERCRAWIAAPPGQPPTCAACAKRAEPKPAAPKPRPPADPDDLEDGG